MRPLFTASPSWNVVSSDANVGYRPLILTPKNQSPLPDGDFIVIIQSGSQIIGNIGQGGTAKLCRSKSMSKINNANQWLSPGYPKTLMR